MSRARIRPARLADAAALAAVHLESFRAGNGPHLPAEAVAARTPERNLAEWEGVLAHLPERAAILVAEVDGHLVGVAGAGSARDRGLDPTATGELYALYVHPDAWGGGYGFALHEAAVRPWRQWVSAQPCCGCSMVTAGRDGSTSAADGGPMAAWVTRSERSSCATA